MNLLCCLTTLALLGLLGMDPVRTQDKNVIARPQSTADARSRLSPRDAEAIHLEILKQRQASRDLHIRTMSDLQTRHHETMMQIIRNIGPSGRYEYNPATGRYDRYVPHPR
jgi:hypothetical protein